MVVISQTNEKNFKLDCWTLC